MRGLSSGIVGQTTPADNSLSERSPSERAVHIFAYPVGMGAGDLRSTATVTIR